MKIFLIQDNFTVADLKNNLNKILFHYENSKNQGADLIVFPELALTGYLPEDLLLREDFLEAVALCLEKLISKVDQIPLILGCPLKNDQGFLENCALVIQNQKILFNYAKQCLPNYGVFDEKRYFSPGNKSVVFQCADDTPKIGLLICEDVWHLETAEQAKAAGAEVLLSIHASPYALKKEEQRQAVYEKAAQITHLPLLATFIVGAQDELCFDAGARALNAEGKIVVQAPFFQTASLIVELKKKEDAWIIVPSKEFSPVIYQPIAHLYQSLVVGLRDYIKKNFIPGVVLGLSGGIDSALTLLIAMDAIGVENITAVSLPSRYTSDISLQAITEQVNLTGVELKTIPIQEIVNANSQLLTQAMSKNLSNKTEENIQARCRGLLLMAIANETQKIVLATSNKSEMVMGYSTLYGDMIGGFAPLKDVPKTLVYQLAYYRNKIKYLIPEIILKRAPTAELAFNQTDQDSLPPYEILDEIIDRFIHQQQSMPEIVSAGFDPEVVKKIIKTLALNEYKRRQSPPGIKITDISFTKERRYPMTVGSWQENKN